jgi:hypothetical protein
MDEDNDSSDEIVKKGVKRAEKILKTSLSGKE